MRSRRLYGVSTFFAGLTVSQLGFIAILGPFAPTATVRTELVLSGLSAFVSIYTLLLYWVTLHVGVPR